MIIAIKRKTIIIAIKRKRLRYNAIIIAIKRKRLRYIAIIFAIKRKRLRYNAIIIAIKRNKKYFSVELASMSFRRNEILQFTYEPFQAKTPLKSKFFLKKSCMLNFSKHHRQHP
jgi:hypothetical protein